MLRARRLNLEADHDSDPAQRHVGGEAGEAAPHGGARPGEAEILVDHLHRSAGPAQLHGPLHQRVLAIGGLAVAFELAWVDWRT